MKSASPTTRSKPASFIADANLTGPCGWIHNVTSTSALRRGIPYAITACAPKTYHRPHPRRTAERSRSSSTAAGGTGTAKSSRKANMRLEIGDPLFGVGPGGIVCECLLAQFVRDAKAFERAQALDARGPVAVLQLADRVPVAVYE